MDRRRMREGKNPSRPYCLRDEKIYLDFLGYYRVGRDPSTEVRKKFLEQYIDTIGQREEDWVSEARDYARKLLNKLKNGSG